MTRSIKMDDAGGLLLLAAPFSGPFPGGLDSDGERFSSRTDFCTAWAPSQRPLLFDHGLDPEIGVEPLGTVDLSSAVKDAEGLWLRGILDRSSKYWRMIRALLARAEPVLYASSGAYSHLVERGKGGELLRWPLIEVSLTPTPSNFHATVTPERAKAMKSAGLSLPAVVDPPADHTALWRDVAVTIISARATLERSR